MKQTQFKLGPLQKKWIKLLRENPDLQIRGQLGKREHGKLKYCCLGLAGHKVLKSCVVEEDRIKEKNDGSRSILKNSYEELGLYDKIGRTNYESEKKRRLKNEPDSLVDFNDDDGKWGDWIDLSYMMENVPELFFNESK